MSTEPNESTTAFHSFSEFVAFVKKVKKKNQLHPIVETRLVRFLQKLYPDDYQATEVAGVLGGRNDLMQFSFNSRRVVFELFFSPSQVPQDLRLLEQSSAEVKIAILLDEQIDSKLADEYFHKKPDPFPFLRLSWLMLEEREQQTLARLRELIDEKSPITMLRRILSNSASSRLEEQLRQQLEEMEASLSSVGESRVNLPNLSGAEVLALIILGHVKKLGISAERLGATFAWLRSNTAHAMEMVSLGFQVFLVTDLTQRHAIWTDSDLADNIIFGAEETDQAYITICLNKIINDALVRLGYDRRTIQWHFFHAYAEDEVIIIPPPILYQSKSPATLIRRIKEQVKSSPQESGTVEP